ncbi:MAG TPA: hypothetical protein VFV71_01880 [Burkholderiales bacterium]|nr:hypothetical protein [Burkholderiales bacterium]
MSRAIGTVYHMLDAGNWPSVRKHGLLSAARLMQAAGEQAGTARRHRPDGRRLASGALIRNQKPMPPHALERCLRDGLTPEDWFELLNAKVFFWLDAERLNRQRRACGPSPQIVLVVNAARMLAAHRARAAVTPINTGNAMRAAAPRNLSTFVPYARWVEDGWRHESIAGAAPRPSSHRPVELTIDDAVPDILDYVTGLIPLRAGESFNAGLHPTQRHRGHGGHRERNNG